MSRTNLTFPNGIQTTYTYDSVSQVTDILHQLPVTSTQIYKAGRPTTSIRSSREGGKDYPKNRPPTPTSLLRPCCALASQAVSLTNIDLSTFTEV